MSSLSARLAFLGDTQRLPGVAVSNVRCYDKVFFHVSPVEPMVVAPKKRPAKPEPARPFADVYRRLRDLGLTKPFLRDMVLPTWWDDEAAATPAGRMEGLLILARNLGLDFGALRDGSNDLKPAERPNVRFKKRNDADEEDLRLAEQLAHQVGRHAALGVPSGHPLPTDATTIREEILDDADAKWISLENLLRYCWRHGVGVLHAPRFPPGTKKMQGMAMRADNIPVIILTSEKKASGWLLFDLAHELGHICCGHVGADAAIVDEIVDQESTDTEEAEANEFAIELLTGNATTRVAAPDRWPNAVELTRQAQALATRMQSDPTHIVLNYAHSMSATGGQFWGVANAALKILEPNANAPAMVRRALDEYLDWSALPGDSSEFVARMTKIGADDE